MTTPRKPATASGGASFVAGGPVVYGRLVGVQARDAAALEKQVLAGLRYGVIEKLQEFLGVSIKELVSSTMMSTATLARRKQQGRLSADESDRVLRLARIANAALQLFEGDRDATRTWMTSKHAALGGKTPLRAARTDVGAREVEALIGRLEFGVVS